MKAMELGGAASEDGQPSQGRGRRAVHVDLGMGKVVVDARLAWLPAVIYRRGLGMNARAFGEVSGPSLTLRMALLLTFLAC